MWAYQVGNGGNFLSPILSLDGKKVAFVSGANPRARFNVLTWVAGQGSVGAPATPGTGGSAVTSLDYTNITNAGCTATGAGNSNSSPFIDYKNNAVYVGADNGKFYRIKNVFTGTPVVDYLHHGSGDAALTSPVYDSFSKKGIRFGRPTRLRFHARCHFLYSGASVPGSRNCWFDYSVADGGWV
jgi:hypothetical protein